MLWKGFQRPKRLEFERETLTDRFGRFYAQPFERGFGTTIGNALRRVLLSSIEGAAITAVKIDGVQHEFSPIPGVVEDATDIILNLKQIPLKLHVDHTKTLTLRAVALHLHGHRLDVEHDVDHVLADAGNRRELMQHVVDLDRRDGRTLQRGEQHAAQRVADRRAEAAFERLRVETAVSIGEGLTLDVEPFGSLKTFPEH